MQNECEHTIALRNAGMIVLDFLEDINDHQGIDSGHLTAS